MILQNLGRSKIDQKQKKTIRISYSKFILSLNTQFILLAGSNNPYHGFGSFAFKSLWAFSKYNTGSPHLVQFQLVWSPVYKT